MAASESRGSIGDILKSTFSEFIQDGCMRMAAALSYYTIFSLAPLLVLILLLVGFFFDPDTIRRTLDTQFSGMIGPDGAQQIQSMIADSEQTGDSGTVATILGVVMLVFGATGAFIELQHALNRAWDVAPDPEAGGLKTFISKRVLSFGLVLVIAFMLLVSLALSAMLSAFGDALGGMLPGGVSEVLLQVINVAVSLLVISLLFSAIFKMMPDAEIAWKDVWIGGFATALLFVVGKFAIGFYLGQSDPGSAFGAAGSLAVILVWIYYSAIILFLGAEFTQAWAEQRGSGIRPEAGAIRVEQRTVPVDAPESSDRHPGESREPG